ncbi:MAG: hypothetical protein A3E98_03415 [Candidatus Doudnabacteria bacterium RIFCSPHIGHO2_12_FULL_48_11]|nr:MAG: hypothetical protein A3E98_03415 [Candidatus Doudnabacteria bacterium RIFCSPHIGHO2_12_FULL_48_11]
MDIITNSEIEEFIFSLEKKTIAKVLRTVDLLERFSYRLPMPHSKKITGNLFELRTRGRQEVRIFYCFCQGKIYLLSGFVKKSQQTPRKELDRAKSKLKALTSYNL